MIINTKKMSDEEELETEKFEKLRSFTLSSDELTDTEIAEFREKKKKKKKKKRELKLTGEHHYDQIDKK